MTQAVVNPEHEKLTPTPEKNFEITPKPTVESQASPSLENHSEPIVSWGVDGKLRAELLMGEARAVVKPLLVETFIGESSNKMKEAGEAVADGASGKIKEGDTEGATELMAEQIHKQRLESDGTFTLSEAFREIPNVYAIEPGGFDTAKLGNKMNFSSDMMFGINPAEADHMLDLLQHPKSGVGEIGATFALKKNSPLDNEKEGFEVTFQDKDGVKKEIMFLYLNMNGAKVEAENSQQNKLIVETGEKPVAEQVPSAVEVPKAVETKAEESTPEKPVEPVVDAAEPKSESGTNGENDEGVNKNQENIGDTVAASAEEATTAKVLDTRDNTAGVSNVININKKPVSYQTPPQPVSPENGDLSKAA
jgi:hypothetical protein